MHRRTVCILLAVTSMACFALLAPAGEPSWLEGLSWPAWTAAGNASSSVQPVSDSEAQQWLRWVIPLRKRVLLTGKLVLPASALAPRLRDHATDVERTARDELVGLIAKKTGTEQLAGSFPILMGVCDARGMIDNFTVVPEPGSAALWLCVLLVFF